MDSIDNKMNIRTPRTDVNQSSQQAGRVAKPSLDEGSSQATSSSTASADKVTFTSAAAEMLKLEETLASIPDVDNDRVATIKASIAEGSYQVDAEKIVSNLLTLEKDLQ